MRRYFESLRPSDLSAINSLPDGIFLVRVDRAQYRWHTHKPYYEIRFAVLKPKHLTGCTIAGRLYCTTRAMWKLSWFLCDFGYDPELLGNAEIDDKALIDLWGVVKVSEVTVHGIPVLSFDGFAPAARWKELSPDAACPTAASVFPRTPVPAVPISGCAWGGRSWLTPRWCGAQEQTTLVGLTSLRTRMPPMLPKLNRKRALFVLTKIDEILAWERRSEVERDTRFVELGRYLCEVRAGQYWRVEKLKSFDEFLARRFPESRRKAYYLMSIHEHLPPQARKELREVGWTKGLELAKVARRDGQEFDCATWLHKARSLPKDQFKQEVEKELTGRETEPWEIVYFKLYKSQIPVVEQAMETAALMLGTDKSRGYCLEMICADFLASTSLEKEDPSLLLQSMSRFFKFLPGEQRRAFLHEVTEKAS